ncbi:MAG TPA: PilT/PilU family type 4a pilus ATPase, partial [Myxococcota bacterium]|nr:PilT/PilU family type 4a pilus ATPase [Myxococcota bacterium]
MAQKKPIPLVGRLAMQLEMLTSEEVERAMAQSASSGNPRLAQIFLQMGLLDRDQVLKLQKVQRQLVEKHRARQAEAPDRAVLGRVGGDARSGTRPPARDARAVSAAEVRDGEDIHREAAHAAQTAAPLSARDVEDPAAAGGAPPSSAGASPSGVGPASSPEGLSEGSEASTSPPSASPAASPSAPDAASVPAMESSDPPPPLAARESESEESSLELPVPEPAREDRARLESILAAGVRDQASDIHLHAGAPLKRRIHGELLVHDETATADEVERMVAAALSPDQRRVLGHEGEIDFCLELPGIGRFRANAYRQQRGLDVVFRSIPSEPPTLESLGLPPELAKYTNYHQGMVLVTGPAGCGKSSTLAALVDHINRTRDEHILTIEDPIEVLHPSRRCLVNQRHAGHHTASFSRALRGALREDPDIIVIGELRDLETISLAMTAAETGHFVLASLHTANAVRTVNRMIGAFPSNEQDQVRAMLSESLKAVISQRLVPTADGLGRVAALELLVINRAIGNLIRDEKTVQI